MQLKGIITLLAVLFMLPLSIDAKKENNGGDGSTDRRYQYFFIEAMRQQSMGNYASAFELLSHAKDIDGNKPEVYYYLAMYLAQMEKDSLALTSLEKAVSLAPKNETYQERLAQFYIGNGKYDKATEAYTRLCDEHSYRTDAMKILLQLYQQEKNYTKMLEVINRIEQVDGESEDLTLSKVRVYELMNKPENAHKALKELADNHPYDINYQIMLGNWLLQNNKTDEAYGIFTKALKEEANNPYAQSSLYDYYKQHGDSAKAADMMEKILVSTEQSIENKLQFVREAIKENEQHGGDSIKMLSLFNRMIAASPEETDIRELEVAYMKMKKFPTTAIDSTLTSLLNIAPDNASARFQLLQNKWSSNDWDSIIALSEPGTQYNPEEMVFYYFTGLAYYQKGEDDKALSFFQKGVAEINDESSSDIVSDFYCIMGDILFKKGKATEAFAAYDSCLQWKPDNISCLNNYAYYLSLNNQNLKKAEEMSVKTIQAEPTSATYLDTYAWILFLEGRYEEAKMYIDQAISNDSTDESSADVYEHAGDIHAMAGDIDKAVEYWKQAQKRGGESKILARKIKQRKYIKK